MGLPVAKSTGSHHLKVLREAGIVTAEVDGTRKYHTLRRDDLEARFPGLLDSVLRVGDVRHGPLTSSFLEGYRSVTRTHTVREGDPSCSRPRSTTSRPTPSTRRCRET